MRFSPPVKTLGNPVAIGDFHARLIDDARSLNVIGVLESTFRAGAKCQIRHLRTGSPENLVNDDKKSDKLLLLIFDHEHVIERLWGDWMAFGAALWIYVRITIIYGKEVMKKMLVAAVAANLVLAGHRTRRRLAMIRT